MSQLTEGRGRPAAGSGRLALVEGDVEAAERLFLSALEQYRSWVAVPFRDLAELELSRCLRALGRVDEADALRAAARLELERLGAAAGLDETANAVPGPG
ncbi:MAG: hypothetical protein ABI873_00045 [Marmoricola sp.]